MNPTNPNPYPTGRWTQPPSRPAAEPARTSTTPAKVKASPPKKRLRRTVPKLETGLVDLPLKKLFWELPESATLEESAARIESAIRTFLVREAMLDCEFRV